MRPILFTLLTLPFLGTSAMAQCNVSTSIMPSTGCDAALFATATCSSANTLSVTTSAAPGTIGFLLISGGYVDNAQAAANGWALMSCLRNLCPFNVDPTRSIVLPLDFRAPVYPGLSPLTIYAQPWILEPCRVGLSTGSVLRIQF